MSPAPGFDGCWYSSAAISARMISSLVSPITPREVLGSEWLILVLIADRGTGAVVRWHLWHLRRRLRSHHRHWHRRSSTAHHRCGTRDLTTHAHDLLQLRWRLQECLLIRRGTLEVGRGRTGEGSIELLLRLELLGET